MRRALFVLPLLAFCVLARADALEPLRRDDAVDDIALGRLAAETGDATLASVLDGGGGRDLVVAAVRASVHAHAPEALVPALVKLSVSRDPQLSDEAGAALTALFERLNADELASREVLLADLKSACAGFDVVDDAPKPRPDLAQALANSRARCTELMKAAHD
jgi:hypothetical protein